VDLAAFSEASQMRSIAILSGSALGGALRVLRPEALVGIALTRRPGRSCPRSRPQGDVVLGAQRLSDAEQLEILALLEAACTEDSATSDRGAKRAEMEARFAGRG